MALGQTIDRILDINRKRKHLTSVQDSNSILRNLDTELKLLNKLAEQQAGMIRKYEKTITEMDKTKVA